MRDSLSCLGLADGDREERARIAIEPDVYLSDPFVFAVDNDKHRRRFLHIIAEPLELVGVNAAAGNRDGNTLGICVFGGLGVDDGDERVGGAQVIADGNRNCSGMCIVETLLLAGAHLSLDPEKVVGAAGVCQREVLRPGSQGVIDRHERGCGQNVGIPVERHVEMAGFVGRLVGIAILFAVPVAVTREHDGFGLDANLVVGREVEPRNKSVHRCSAAHCVADIVLGGRKASPVRDSGVGRVDATCEQRSGDQGEREQSCDDLALHGCGHPCY